MCEVGLLSPAIMAQPPWLTNRICPCQERMKYMRFSVQQKAVLYQDGSMLRKMRLELTRYEYHKILSLARLPIPTLPRTARHIILTALP